MALPSSGQLTFSQVCTELGISTTNANSRTMASSASPAKSTPDGLNEFWGYSHATPVTPTKCSISKDGSGFVQVIFFCNVANDACQVRYRKNSGTWSGWTDRTSAWVWEYCVTSALYEAEIRGRIGTNYSTPCYPSSYTGCP